MLKINKKIITIALLILFALNKKSIAAKEDYNINDLTNNISKQNIIDENLNYFKNYNNLKLEDLYKKVLRSKNKIGPTKFNKVEEDIGILKNKLNNIKNMENINSIKDDIKLFELSINDILLTVSQNESKPFIKGYNDKTFRGDNYITRAEVSSAVSNLMGNVDIVNFPQYEDIYNHWSLSDITKLYNNNIYNNTNFNINMFFPNKNITRAETLVILLNYMNVNFIKEYNIDHWASNYIGYALENNIIYGRSDDLALDDPITRAEFVTIMNRLFNRSLDLNITTNFSDIKGKWYYNDVIKATNYYI